MKKKKKPGLQAVETKYGNKSIRAHSTSPTNTNVLYNKIVICC